MTLSCAIARWVWFQNARAAGHSITQSLNNNCARGLIPRIHIWQWLKREKMSTISSFMFAASVSKGQAMYLDEPTLRSLSVEP